MNKGHFIYPEEINKKPIWLPYGATYNPDMADKFELWCFNNLVFPKGGHFGGEPLVWTDWQREDIIHPLLGVIWEKPPYGLKEGDRVIRRVFYLSGRGTGKTLFGAAYSLWTLDDGPDEQPMIDMFAATKDQADRLFNAASRLIENSESLLSRIHVLSRSKEIFMAHTRTWGIKTRTGDSETELGLEPNLTLLDELLSQKNGDLWSTIITAQGKRPNSLLITFTTPALDVMSFAKKEYDTAKDVINNRDDYPDYLPIIYETTKEDDIHDKQTWIKACPSLGSGFMDWSTYSSASNEARKDTMAERHFRVYRLAQWVDAGHGYLNMTAWDNGLSVIPDDDYLNELPCWFGLDMSLTEDLTSLCMLFDDKDNDCLWVKFKSWITKSSYNKMLDYTNYDIKEWKASEETDLRVVPGRYMDYERVAEEVIRMAQLYNPVEIVIDTFQSGTMNKLLGDEGAGFNVETIQQTGKLLKASVERVADEVSCERVKHNGCNLVRWTAGNCAVKYSGEIPKVIKSGDEAKSLDKIDPIDALIMATHRLIIWEREGSYHNPEFYDINEELEKLMEAV